MLKYILENEKTAPNVEQKWQKTGWTNLPRNLGKAWQQWLQCLQGGGGRRSITIHAYILIQGRMHANSDTEE